MVVDEISFRFESVNPKSKIETGSAGITPDGTYKQKKIPYLLSDTHITEILDQVCDNRWDKVSLVFVVASVETNEHGNLLVFEGKLPLSLSQLALRTDGVWSDHESAPDSADELSARGAGRPGRQQD